MGKANFANVKSSYVSTKKDRLCCVLHRGIHEQLRHQYSSVVQGSFDFASPSCRLTDFIDNEQL